MTSESPIVENFMLGMQAFVKGDFSESEALFTKILTGTPDYKPALVSRGAARLKDNRAKVAIQDFDRAIELDNANARAFHLRGLAYEKQGLNDAAVDDFNRAIAIDPEYGAAYYSRANLYAKMNRAADAAADMQEVAQLTQQNVTAYAHDNNMIHSEHLRVEDAMETELSR